MSVSQKPLVLIVDQDEALLELNREILEGAGYRVETPPKDADLLRFIENTHPQVVVVDVPHQMAQTYTLVTALQSNPTTRDIPVVVISTATTVAADAKANPVASAAVVAPYDIDQLEGAVAQALKIPPPAAALPPASHPPSSAVNFATEELAQNAHRIVIGTIKELRGVEPYKSRFEELTPGLVDNLGKMLGAINQGLRRSLTPSDVFSAPAIRRSIEEHVELRKSQRIDAAANIQEYQILAHHISQFIYGLVGQDTFTEQDALHLNDRLLRYVDELVRVAIRIYNTDNNPTR